MTRTNQMGGMEAQGQQAAQQQGAQLLQMMQQGADVAATIAKASPTVGQGGAGGGM